MVSGDKALKAAAAVTCPVPPEPIARVELSPAAVPVVDWLRVGTSPAWRAASVTLVPSDRSTLPALWVPVSALIAACCVACPVPPCATGSAAARCVAVTVGFG